MPQNKCILDFGQLFNEDAALYLSLFILVAYDYFSRFAKPVSGGLAPAHPFKMAAQKWLRALWRQFYNKGVLVRGQNNGRNETPTAAM